MSLFGRKSVPEPSDMYALKKILHNSPLIRPWLNGDSVQLTEGDVERAMQELSGLVIVQTAGGLAPFLVKTDGGTLDPKRWSFYDALPATWPPAASVRDPFFEPINTPTNEPDKISEAALGGMSVGEKKILEALARIEAKIDAAK